MKVFLLLIILTSCAKDILLRKNITSATLKVCYVGDMGSGWEAQRDVALVLEEENCDKLFFLGDLIYQHGLRDENDPQLKEKFLDPYENILKQGKEFYIALGNHDHHRNPLAWVKIAQMHPQIIFPHPYYRVNMDGLCYVVVDSTNLQFYTSVVSGLEQRSWLHDIKPEIKQCSLKILIAHHPYLNRGFNHGASGGLLKSTQENYILGTYDYLIAGHEHLLSDEGIKNGTRLIVSGAGGKPADNEPAGYYVMELEKIKEKWKVKKDFFRRVKVRKSED